MDGYDDGKPPRRRKQRARIFQKSAASHYNPEANGRSWLTPPEIIQALGPFDLDPTASPEPRPWATATVMWTKKDTKDTWPRDWRVWLNPPFGERKTVSHYLGLMAAHNYGTALLYAATSEKDFFSYVWPLASAFLFCCGRLDYRDPWSGKPAKSRAARPSVLIAYGPLDAYRLETSGIKGMFLRNTTPYKIPESKTGRLL